MEPTNREAYGAAADQLAEFSASADVAGISKVADEILAVADLLRREPRLRRALADPAAPESSRTELVRSLLAGKAKPATLSLAQLAVAGFGGRGFDTALNRLVE